MSTPGIALDRWVDDELTLSTVEGAEDFLVQELTDLESVGVLRRGRGEVGCRVHGSMAGLHRIRLYSTAGVAVAAEADHDDFLDPLRHSADHGVVRSITTAEPLRFRVGTSSAELMQAVIGRVERDLGWVNDPSAWQVNLDQSAGGWVAQIGGLAWAQRFGQLERLPWSTTPLIGEVMARLAKPQSGQVVVDPCCGTGTLLVAVDQLSSGCQLQGTDRDPGAITKAEVNLGRFAVTAQVTVADALPIAHAPGSVDRVISNLPFGKRVGSHHENTEFYPRLLNEISRVLGPSGRAVLLTEDKRLLVDSVSRTKGLKIVRERLLAHGGATPTAYVLTRTRR